MDIVQLITDNKDIVAAATGLITACSAIVKFTPNQTTSKVLYWIVKVCQVVAMNTKPIELKK